MPPRNLGKDWAVMSIYQRFEAAVAVIITFAIGVVIVVALYRLIVDVILTLVSTSLNPLDHTVFQHVFGQVMTVLIALEFNYSLRYVVAGERSIIQTQVVLLIALLALARKVIIMDVSAMTATSLMAMATLVLALGLVYFLIRERDIDQAH